MEVLSARISNKTSHTFSFSKQVQQFMVGFSDFDIKYEFPDHHVKRISIDLTNASQNGNNVIVKPILELSDTSDHNESFLSKITVVVLAKIEQKTNVSLLTNVKTDVNYNLPFNKATFVKSALSYYSVEFPRHDHHLNLYYSNLDLKVTSDKYILRGESSIQDHGENYGDGKVLGSVFIYSGDDKKVLCADFCSKTIGSSGKIYLGKVNENLHSNDYKLACFINKYLFTYGSGKDHHVLGIQASVELQDENLICENGGAYAKIKLESLLKDNEKHRINIPQNTISGFVIAFANELTSDTSITKKGFNELSDRSISSSDNVLHVKSAEKEGSIVPYQANNNQYNDNSSYLKRDNIGNKLEYYNNNNQNTEYVDNSGANSYSYSYSCNCCILL